MTRVMRTYQCDGYDRSKQAIAEGCRHLLLMAPTGAGKTTLAAKMAEGVLRKGRRMIFTVPKISLVDQTLQSFFEDGIRDVGVLQADHPMTDPSQPIQIASLQTLARRTIPPADLVIVDEAHIRSAFLERWMADRAWRRVPFIGLTATPWTRGLGKHWERLIVVETVRGLIDQGYLSPFRVFAPSHPDLGGVRTVAGDYHEGDLGEAVNRPTIVADVVETWRVRGENRPTLVFAVNRAHAKALQAQFELAGISAGYVDAYTDRNEREAIRQRFHAGTIKVVCNVGVLTTGVDWDVRCIVLARPTKSESLFVQMVGRGLRLAEGKTDCLILDHSDTHLRLGFVTDIHHDTLDDGRPANLKVKHDRKEPLPKDCPSCGFVRPAKVHTCPACGFKPEKQADVEQLDGELVQMSQAPRRKGRMTRPERKYFFQQLRWIAKTRGYSEGWASHKFRERTGDWPSDYRTADPVEPTLETLAWVKSRQIAFAKRRNAA